MSDIVYINQLTILLLCSCYHKSNHKVIKTQKSTSKKTYRIAENFGGRKLWRIWRFTTNLPIFIRQLLAVSEKKLKAGLKFAKVFFAKCNLASYSPKFSPAKILHYTVL